MRVGPAQEGFNTIIYTFQDLPTRLPVAVINTEEKRAKNHVCYMGTPILSVTVLSFGTGCVVHIGAVLGASLTLNLRTYVLVLSLLSALL